MTRSTATPPATPYLARTPEEFHALALPGRVALVPTMGALHAGHRALIAAAREWADSVVVSVFVNPMQFGPNEDYDSYPRTFDTDMRVCAAEGVDAVFAPTAEIIYPGEQIVTVDPGPMGRVLEGEHRPGFFTGVLTVVGKLLNLLRPDAAFFGEKDAQQLALVRRMVRDLGMAVVIHSGATVRDPDGLATSSRNVYLSEDERATALSLPRALTAGVAAADAGPHATLEAARAVLKRATVADPPLTVDYVALVDPDTFAEVRHDYRGHAVLAAAVRVGGTRLIDNMPLTL